MARKTSNARGANGKSAGGAKRSVIWKVADSGLALMPGFRAAASEASDTSKRAAVDFRDATGAGPNATGMSILDRERARSRKEVLDNEYADKAVDIQVSYIVGNGLRPHIPDDPDLARRWNEFVPTADAHGVVDFYGLQQTAVREMIEGGEVLALRRFRRKEDGLAVPFQIQLLEGEYLPTARMGGMPDTTIAGIELDELERRTAYWLYDRHPAEGLHTGRGAPKITRTPVDRVYHMFRPLRSGQLRGRPWIAKTLPQLRAVEKYEKADLAKKLTAALLGVIVKMPSADDDVSKVLGMSSDEPETEAQNWAMAPLEPGAIIGTPPGADVSIVNPNDSQTGYRDAWKTRYLKVAAGLGVPYFLLTGDYTGHNDRTLRLAMIDFYRSVKKYRQIVNHQFNAKVWRDFLTAAEEAGWKPMPGKTRADYERVEWIGEPLAHIHPVQEENAVTNAIRSGSKTLAEVLQERGSDLETFIRQKKIENQMLDDAGIVLDTDPRKVTRAGGYQEAMPAGEENS